MRFTFFGQAAALQAFESRKSAQRLFLKHHLTASKAPAPAFDQWHSAQQSTATLPSMVFFVCETCRLLRISEYSEQGEEMESRRKTVSSQRSYAKHRRSVDRCDACAGRDHETPQGPVRRHVC